MLKKLQRNAIWFGILFLLSGCPNSGNKIEPQNQSSEKEQQIASAIMSQANEPLQASMPKVNQENEMIGQFALLFTQQLTEGKYSQARQMMSFELQKKYPEEILSQRFKRILQKTGTNPQPVSRSLIVDRTMARMDKGSVADVYLSVKGKKNAKAIYLRLCGFEDKPKVCGIGWGTEDTGG